MRGSTTTSALLVGIAVFERYHQHLFAARAAEWSARFPSPAPPIFAFLLPARRGIVGGGMTQSTENTNRAPAETAGAILNDLAARAAEWAGRFPEAAAVKPGRML